MSIEDQPNDFRVVSLSMEQRNRTYTREGIQEIWREEGIGAPLVGGLQRGILFRKATRGIKVNGSGRDPFYVWLKKVEEGDYISIPDDGEERYFWTDVSKKPTRLF